MSKKPVLLCIMDGFGWVPNETYGNAVVAAKTPHLDALMAKYPMTTIEASGMAVGLPDGQMGNSEVGHTNMGAGRIVYQQLTLITKSIRDGEMFKNPVLVKNMKAAIEAGKAIHLMGLVGTGGVHSHADHWFGVLEMAKHMGAKEVYLHCITDGRDTDPHAGKGFLADLQAKLDELGVGKIASVSGRYYAMDRDNNWDREEKAYAAFVYGEGNHAANAAEAIEASYAADKTDERSREILRNASYVIDEAIRSLREISVNLSPHILKDFGLARAVSNFIGRLPHSGMRIHFSTNLHAERFDADIEVILYRVICELINNSIKHSGAAEASVSLIRIDSLIRLDYRDNGCGFETGGVEQQEGMGIANIRSRISSLKGDFTLSSSPGRGMKALVEVHI